MMGSLKAFASMFVSEVLHASIQVFLSFVPIAFWHSPVFCLLSSLRLTPLVLKQGSVCFFLFLMLILGQVVLQCQDRNPQGQNIGQIKVRFTQEGQRLGQGSAVLNPPQGQISAKKFTTPIKKKVRKDVECSQSKTRDFFCVTVCISKDLAFLD